MQSVDRKDDAPATLMTSADPSLYITCKTDRHPPPPNQQKNPARETIRLRPLPRRRASQRRLRQPDVQGPASVASQPKHPSSWKLYLDRQSGAVFHYPEAENVRLSTGNGWDRRRSRWHSLLLVSITSNCWRRSRCGLIGESVFKWYPVSARAHAFGFVSRRSSLVSLYPSQWTAHHDFDALRVSRAYSQLAQDVTAYSTMKRPCHPQYRRRLRSYNST